MIGPTSTFYNPEVASLQQGLDHGQYQQWIEGYGPQQQQNQQIQHHYPQQMVYDTSYHGSLNTIPLSYQFTQPQYESSSSLSQYDGSTTGTVTQSNVGQNRDNSFQGQSNVYPQVYPEIMAMKQSAASNSERIREVVNRSHSAPSSQRPQQNPSQQSRQQQVRRKLPRAPQAQQNHAHKFLAHPSSSEFTSSNPSSSHSSSLTPPSIVWSTEPGYPNPKPIENTSHGGQSSFRVPSSNSGSSKPPTSRNTPTTTNSPNSYPTTSGVFLESNPRTSPPRSNDLTFVPEKTSRKRKRLRKNEPAQLSGGGGESDSDSEEDEGMAGGISVGMGGLGVVGKGTGTKGSRLWVLSSLRLCGSTNVFDGLNHIFFIWIC